jgi:hypothetical protein
MVQGNKPFTLTASSIGTFRDCRKRYYWRNVRCLVKAREMQREALDFGSYVHDQLHKMRARGMSDGAPVTLAPYELAKARACVEAYARKWGDVTEKVLLSEYQWSARLPGRKGLSRKVILKGKVDAVVLTADKAVALRETKTTSRVDEGYLGRLPVDLQLHLYVWALRMCTLAIEKVEYDILTKPQLRPKDGESPDDFETRCLASLVGNPAALLRIEVPICEADIKATMDEVLELYRNILWCMKSGKWYRNDSQCVNKYGRTCQYLDLCKATDPDAVAQCFYVYRAPHEELEGEGNGVA